MISLEAIIGPNTNNEAYFLGIVSTLKANNSIQIINFSNRFSITDGSIPVNVNPSAQNISIAPSPARKFECNRQLCSSDDAFSGLSLATPTAPAVTSIPASVFESGISDIESDHDVFLFNVVFVTLGIAGALFTISCFATCIFFRRRDGTSTISGIWGTRRSMRFGRSAQFAKADEYETAELACEEKSHIFELAAGSTKSRASNLTSSSAHELSANAIKGEHGDRGFPVAAAKAANTSPSSNSVEPGETTILLSTNASHSRTNSVTGQPLLYMPPQPPARPPKILSME